MDIQIICKDIMIGKYTTRTDYPVPTSKDIIKLPRSKEESHIIDDYEVISRIFTFFIGIAAPHIILNVKQIDNLT